MPLDKKLFFIVLDGAADIPTPSLNGKTPLEVAKKPYINSLGQHAVGTMIYPIEKGVAPESDAAVMSLLSYDVKKSYTGRGPLEALGSGMDFKDGNLALRCNFATGEGNKIIDRRCGRNLSTREASELADYINKHVKLKKGQFIFKNTIGHRGVVVFKAENLFSNISNYDPAYSREGAISIAKEHHEMALTPVVALDKSSEKSAELVNEFAEQCNNILGNAPTNMERAKNKQMPANRILMRDAGTKLPSLTPLSQKFNKKFAAVTEMPVERGIAKVSGMEDLYIAMDDSMALEQRYKEMISKIKENMNNIDVFYIHLKGPDEPGHDGDIAKKVRAIELIDQFFFKPFLEIQEVKKHVILITSDHSTPCIKKSHTPDPVGLMIYSNNLPYLTSNFCESNMNQDLGISKGEEVLSYVFNNF